MIIPNFWNLKNFDLLKGLDEKNINRISTFSDMAIYKKDSLIYLTNDPSESVYLLKKGRVKLTRISDEKELILDIINPGGIFGLKSFFEDNHRSDNAVAMSDVMVCIISKNDFIVFINDFPEIRDEIYSIIGKHFKGYTKRMENLIFRNPYQRIVSFLMNLIGTDYGKPDWDNKIVIKPFFSQQDIAELADCSRQTVNIVLGELKEKKL